MKVNVNEFGCPNCANKLLSESGYLRCNNCEISYPIKDEIIDLRCHRYDYYFNPVSSLDMEKLTREMTSDNWPETIRIFLKRMKYLNTGWLDNLIVDGRYAWKFLLNLTSDTIMLDVGCGLGNLTKNLAPHVAQVYAMDLTYRRLEFSEKRFSIFNPEDKITLVAGGDGPHLPFPDAHLDCVILSGVLEWVGEGHTSPYIEGSKLNRLGNMLLHHFGKRSPRRIQLAFLREIRRVLKTNGQLFIAIENRLNYEYFTGRPDHHSRLKYASLMPRLMANFYSIVSNKMPYRTFTYSIPGYKRLFNQAGFPNVEFFGMSRGYTNLEEIMPADCSIPHWRTEAQSGWKEKIRRNKYFVPAYGILASSAAKPWPRLQDRVFARIRQDLRNKIEGNSLVVNDYLISKKDKLLIKGFFGETKIIIKLPLNDAAIFSEQNNAMLLKHVQSKAGNPDWLPVLLAKGEIVRLHYFVESHVLGTPLVEIIRSSGRTSMLAAVADLLKSLHLAQSEVNLRPLTGEFYHQHVTRRLESLYRVIVDHSIREDLHAFFREGLYGTKVSVGITHGDFSLSNILVEDGRVSGLIDWEAGSLDGLPILDAINYLGGINRLFHPNHEPAKRISFLASDTWSCNEERDFLLRRYAECCINPSNHRALVYLNWLHNMTFLLRFWLIYNPVAIDSFVHRVVRSILR